MLTLLAPSFNGTPPNRGSVKQHSNARADTSSFQQPFQPASSVLRLFVVYRYGVEFSTSRIDTSNRNCTCFAIRRNLDATADHALAALPHVQSQRAFVNRSIGAHVRRRIADDGIVLAIELACPLAMLRLSVAPNTINSDPDPIAHRLQNDRGILRAGAA